MNMIGFMIFLCGALVLAGGGLTLVGTWHRSNLSDKAYRLVVSSKGRAHPLGRAFMAVLCISHGLFLCFSAARIIWSDDLLGMIGMFFCGTSVGLSLALFLAGQRNGRQT